MKKWKEARYALMADDHQDGVGNRLLLFNGTTLGRAEMLLQDMDDFVGWSGCDGIIDGLGFAAGIDDCVAS